MVGSTEIDPDILQLLVEMSCGDATDEQHAHLDELVRTNPELCTAVVTGMTHLADLEWEGRGPASIEANSKQMGSTRPSEYDSVAISSEKSGYTRSLNALDSELLSTKQRAWVPWLGLATSFLIGVTGTLWFTQPWARHAESEHPAADLLITHPPQATVPVATLVSNTSYMWDAQAGAAIETGDALQAGNSVALLDGVAEVEFEGRVTTSIKGPAIFSLSATGIPALKYGKLLLRNDHDSRFLLDVPMARVLMPSGSLVGVDAFGEEVVVHVLRGHATVEPTGREEDWIALESSRAMRLRKDARSRLSYFTLSADPQAFDFDAEGDRDQLAISSDYVELIKKSHPIGYWRFEDIESGSVPNEIGALHALRLVGDQVHNGHREGNSWADFAVRETPGCFVSADTLDELAASDYSVELWLKPSHFHRGALVSLFAHTRDQLGSVERHALILETHSTSPATENLEGRPRSIRFLHRSPPGEILTGTWLFTSRPYLTREWQHLAATKEGSRMRLFLDGVAVASEDDETQLPKKLSLVVGQLFSFGSVRPYVGELDELAVYNRALSTAELQLRVELARHGSAIDRRNTESGVNPMTQAIPSKAPQVTGSPAR